MNFSTETALLCRETLDETWGQFTARKSKEEKRRQVSGEEAAGGKL